MKLPQISLRELFLLVAVVAMGCAWWVDHSRMAADREYWFRQWSNENLQRIWEMEDRAFQDQDA